MVKVSQSQKRLIDLADESVGIRVFSPKKSETKYLKVKKDQSIIELRSKIVKVKQ